MNGIPLIIIHILYYRLSIMYDDQGNASWATLAFPPMMERTGKTLYY